MGYYIANKGVQQGPFELKDLPQHGLREDSLVWTDGMPDWLRADAIPEVAGLLRPAVVEPVQSPTMQAPTLTPVATPVAIRQPQPYGTIAYHTPQPVPSNGMAVASMVLGIVAFPVSLAYCAGIIVAVLAIVFGFIARGRVNRGETTTGGGMALAGIILGFVHIGLIVLFFGFFVIVGIFAAVHSKP